MTFNLLDEQWIPVVEHGRVSLKEVFQDEKLYRLGGSAIEKIALLKLLQAISQAAHTPQDEKEWRQMGEDLPKFGQTCSRYLEKWRDKFDLYGSTPFLQYPNVAKANAKEACSWLPQVASGNNTVWQEKQLPAPMDDGEKALVLLTMMSCALAGKRPDKSVVLAPGYKKKSAKYGPAMEYFGALHTFVFGKSLLETVWLNTFTVAEVGKMPQFSNGLGLPPWEQMPKTEDDAIARKSRSTLQGRLVPLSRFCLIENEGIHVTEGIVYHGYKEGSFDPSMLLSKKTVGKAVEPRLGWVHTDKKPWRELTAICSYLDAQTTSESSCQQVQFCISKLPEDREEITLWSGGLEVQNSTGDQKASRKNDFVESEVSIPTGAAWFLSYQNEMKKMESAAGLLDFAVETYCRKQRESLGDGKSMMSKDDAQPKKDAAKTQFWQRCEGLHQSIIDRWSQPDELMKIRKKVYAILSDVFNEVCPKESAKQIGAWACARPILMKYLKS